VSAVLSPCRQYRYRLDRAVDLFGRVVIGFCLHNPSTADEVADDKTLRRCIGFARALGAARLIVVNPWAGRATDPADLWRLADPVGLDNDAHIADAADEIAASGGFIIAGWGRIQPPAALAAAAVERLLAVEELIGDAGCLIKALGVNTDRSPKNPLYLPSHERPTAWTGLSLDRAMARGRPHPRSLSSIPPEVFMTTDNRSSRGQSGAARAAGDRT
jgi:hypothetical protein